MGGYHNSLALIETLQVIYNGTLISGIKGIRRLV